LNDCATEAHPTKRQDFGAEIEELLVAIKAPEVALATLFLGGNGIDLVV